MEQNPHDRGKQAWGMVQVSQQRTITTAILKGIPQTSINITSIFQTDRKQAAENLVDERVYHTTPRNMSLYTMNEVSGNCDHTRHEEDPFNGRPNPAASSGGLLKIAMLACCRQSGLTMTVLLLLLMAMLLGAAAEVTSGMQNYCHYYSSCHMYKYEIS